MITPIIMAGEMEVGYGHFLERYILNSFYV